MNTFNYSKLKDIRMSAKSTQAEMAQKIGVARTTYADYEKGKIQPPVDKIQNICTALDLPMSDFLIIENDTGVDLQKFKTRFRMSDAEKITQIKAITAKLDIYNGIDEAAAIIQALNLNANEKDLIINLLHYVSTNYELSAMELDILRRIDKARESKPKVGFDVD